MDQFSSPGGFQYSARQGHDWYDLAGNSHASGKRLDKMASRGTFQLTFLRL